LKFKKYNYLVSAYNKLDNHFIYSHYTNLTGDNIQLENKEMLF